MKLSKSIAQKIVSEMMNVIPYNINVMDENGIIIGSGDYKRIGNLHEGAKKVIKEKQIIRIYEDESKMKPGVNEPILFDDKIIGVIGITGNPDEVEKFSKLVCVTANLLIEQSKADEDIHNRRLNREKFFQELIHRKSEYDKSFYDEGKDYGIDLSLSYEVVIVQYNNLDNDVKTLCSKYFSYSEINNNILFLINNNKHMESLIIALKEIKSINKISIGSKETIIGISFEKAKLALEVGRKIKPSTLIYLYEELKFYIYLYHENKTEYKNLIVGLDKIGDKLDLIETIQAYVEENGDINNIAKKLNIHRNTLNYRLDRIRKLTGKNPKNILELFQLISGVLWM